jgi:hypothetical protein
MRISQESLLEHDAVLAPFRAKAPSDDTRSWQWIGKWDSQRHFGITESRARAFAAKHGGEARRMTGGES